MGAFLRIEASTSCPGLLYKVTQAMHIRDRDIGRFFFVIALFIFLLFVFLWPHLPERDAEAYFNFADKRMFLGIPNFFDVISNLGFIYVGLWGMLSAIGHVELRNKQRVWVALFFMNLTVFLTGWGSSYFHLQPTPQSLFWDRAPMSMGFMGLLYVIILDRTNFKMGIHVLFVLMLVGVWTAWYASFENDIRYYIIVQFGSLIFSTLLLLIRRPQYFPSAYLWIAFGFYALAKLMESYDYEVFHRLTWSGHTLKHLAAAVAILMVNLGARTRLQPRRQRLY
ncbi:MAG: hypothetical protein H6623_05210 [Bdellovibrionaceae bacterium]|nr:hypothetical protein [Pseudobdellovibrionaceae bacterium]